MRPIIVEGIDNSGKSTLIKRLVETFGSEVVLSCRSIPLAEQVEWIQAQVERIDDNVIYDRFTLISESVYGPVLRGGSKFDGLRHNYNMMYSEYLRDVMASMNPIIIYCRPSTLSITKTFHEREQMDGTAQHLLQLINQYDIIMDEVRVLTGRVILKYDWQFDIYGKHMINAITNMDKGYAKILKDKFDSLHSGRMDKI